MQDFESCVRALSSGGDRWQAGCSEGSEERPMIEAVLVTGSVLVACACAEVTRRAVLGRHLEHVFAKVRPNEIVLSGSDPKELGDGGR